MMERKTYLVVVGVLVLVGFLGVFIYLNLHVSENNTIKIVTSFPMRQITVGHGIVNGIKLALEEVNYEVSGFKIILVVEDGGDEKGAWQEDIEAEIANRAVADSDVMVYLGTYNSGAAKISIPITNKGGLVQITPGNTWPGLTKSGFLPGEPGIFYPTGIKNYFRVNPTDDLQGPAGAKWAKEIGCESIYIFNDGEAYGVGIGNLVDKEAKGLGLEVLGVKTLDNNKVDEEVVAMKDFNPDLVYFAGITPNGASNLAKAIKKHIPNAKYMGPDGIMEQAFIDQAGESAEGTYLTVVGMPAKELTGMGKVFYDNYKIKYNLEPESFSTFGYEAMKVALLAIERAGVKDRARILEEVSNLGDYDGLFGRWSFDKNGDTSLDLVSGAIVKNGEFVFEKMLT